MAESAISGFELADICDNQTIVLNLSLLDMTGSHGRIDEPEMTFIDFLIYNLRKKIVCETQEAALIKTA